MAPEAGRILRAKRAKDLLDDKVKARLRGEGDDCCVAGCLSSSGSGSEQGGSEPELLSGFVDSVFFVFDNEEDAAELGVEGEGDDAGSLGSDGEGDRGPMPRVPLAGMVRDLLETSAGEEEEGEHFRRDLAADVMEAVERLAGLRSSSRPAFRRAVMSSLTASGYNAGLCKSRWESHGGVTAGCYEYIDVVRPPPDTPATPPSGEQPQRRYLLDVEFAAEFEIARPTAEYAQVAAELPWVYLGEPEELRRLLRLLAFAARRSLRAREMHVPPWRNGRYMQAKWLGPYRRTLNLAPSVATRPAAAAPPPPSFKARDVKYRCVGFDAATEAAAAVAAAWRVAPSATSAR